jgi:hypothetical protein
LKLNVTCIVWPSTLITTIPIWATTITKFGCCQLEAKVNRTQMTWFLLIPASPPSHAKKGYISTGLSYELNNMRPTNMNMAFCFWLRLQAIETFFKEGYNIRGNEIVRGGVQSIW